MYHLHLSALSVGRCAFHVFPPSARRCHRWAVSAAPWRGVSPGLISAGWQAGNEHPKAGMLGPKGLNDKEVFERGKIFHV